MTLAVVALTAFFLVELAKSATPWPFQSWYKAAMAGALALVAMVVWDWGSVGTPTFVGALGAAGGAALLHRLHRLVGAIGDYFRAQVLLATRSRR